MRPGRCLAAIPLPPHGRSDTRPSECIAQRASEPVASQRQDATVRHRRSMTPPSSQGRGGSVLAVRERSLDSFNPLLDAGSGKCDGYSRQSLPSSLSAGRARHERKGFQTLRLLDSLASLEPTTTPPPTAETGVSLATESFPPSVDRRLHDPSIVGTTADESNVLFSEASSPSPSPSVLSPARSAVPSHKDVCRPSRFYLDIRRDTCESS